MFANFIVRVGAPDPASAAVAANRFLNDAGDANNAFALLLLCSYGASPGAAVRVVLVDPGDFRRRDREAQRLAKTLATRGDMLRLAREIRFHDLFVMLGATRSPHEHRVYDKLLEEYQSSVTSPRSEECFLRATDGIVRELLTLSMPDADDYLRGRKEGAERLLAHTTDASFPFTAPGLSLHEARLFDVGAPGGEHFVMASVLV